MKFHHIRIEKSENCPICGDKPKGSPASLRNKFVEETCARDGRSNFIISPKEKVEVDLEAVRKILSERGYPIKASGAFGITFEQSEEITASIIKSGIMIIQTSPSLKESTRERALGIFKSILIDDLGLAPVILPEV